MSDRRPSLKTGAEALNRALDAATPSPDLDRRVRRSAADRRPGATSWRGWGWLVPLPVAAAAILFLLFRSSSGPVTPPEAVEVDGWRVVGAVAAVRLDDDSTVVAERGVRLVDPSTGTRLTVDDDTRLRREDGAFRLVDGAIEVMVTRPASRDEAVRFRVSHGEVIVLGTRFHLEQGAGSGRLRLHEGAIRFVSGDRAVDLSPGEVLAWPLPPADVPEAEAPASAVDAPRSPAQATRRPPQAAPPSPPTVKPEDVPALLSEVAALRSRGRFAEAARRLEDALAGPEGALPEATRERLSFELGTLLAYTLSDPARACAHFAAHRATFGAGRYGPELDRAEATLNCTED